MKKLIISVLSICLFMACTTTSIGPIKGNYPKNPEGQCLINCSFPIQTFDNITVDTWDPWENIVIPAGKHTLKFESGVKRLIVNDRSKTVRLGNTENITIDYDYIPYVVICEITYEFQKGKNYQILGEIWGEQLVSYYKGAVTPKSEDTKLVFSKERNFVLIIPTVKVEEEKKGNPYIRPEASGLMSTGMAFGGIILSPIGERFGMGIIGSKTDIKLVGYGQFGVFIPFKNSFGLSYNFGGLLEYNFPNIGIGVGGGMGGTVASYEGEADEYGWNREKIWETPFQPYLEFNISFRKSINKLQHGIFFHYYPSCFPSGESNWYNSIGFGYKLHTHVRW